MKKKVNRLVSMIIVVIMVCSISGTSAFAISYDSNRQGSITIHMNYDGKTVLGGSFKAYRIASVVRRNDHNLHYDLTEPYLTSGLVFTSLNNSGTANDAYNYIKNKGLHPSARSTNNGGTVIFLNLDQGIYLLVQDKVSDGFHAVNPFLISIPVTDKNGKEWVYDVNASPKLQLDLSGDDEPDDIPGEDTDPPVDIPDIDIPTGENIPEPEITSDIPETDVPTSGLIPPWSEETIPDPEIPKGPMDDIPELIQTGQLNWPIPILVLLGLLFITIGKLFINHSTRSKK